MTETLTFHALDPNGVHLGYLASAVNRAIFIELNGPGSGKFSIAPGAADASLVAVENIVEARWAGSAIFHFVIQKIRRPVVAATKAAMMEVSGQGVLAVLRRALLYPHAWPALTGPDVTEAPLVCAPTFGVGFFGLLTGNVDLPFALSFTPTKDTDLVTWPNDVNMEFRPGQTMWDVVQALTARGYDVRFDPGSRSMDAYVTAGNDLRNTIIFQEGLNILEYTQTSDTLDLATVVLGAGQQDMVESSDFGWTTRRRQAYLQAQNAVDEQQVAAANAALLAVSAAPVVAYDLVVRNSPRAGYDFHVADTITVRTAKLGVQAFRVLTISLEDAAPDFRVTLGINEVAVMPAALRQQTASDALAASASPGNRWRLNARDVRTPRGHVAFDWKVAGTVAAGDGQGGVYEVRSRLQILGLTGGCSTAPGSDAAMSIEYSLDGMDTWSDLYSTGPVIGGGQKAVTDGVLALRLLQPGTWLRFNVDAAGTAAMANLSVRLRTREV